MRTLLRFTALPFVLLLVLAGVLAACGAPEPTNESAAPASGGETTAASAPSEEAGPPAYGDWLVEVTDAEPPHLNTLLATEDATGAYIAAHIFDTLLDVNHDTLEMKANLATDWETSEDHLEYTFHLRDDVTFSDGVPLTAQDVKATYDLIMNPKNDTLDLRNYLQDIEDVQVPDDYTIRFVMSKPYFRHLLVLGGLEVYPAHIYTKGNLNDHPNNRRPIGSGPYVFDRWDTGQQIVLRRNDNYWGKKAYIDKHVFKIITDQNAAFQALERHDVDIYQQIQPEKWVRKASSPKFEREFQKLVLDSPVPGYLSRFNYIGWNMRKPQFSDERVRQALCMLFDRDLIIQEVWYGYGTKIISSIYPKQPEYNHDIKPWPFDPDRAKQLLDEAGWVDTNGDGIRDKDGQKFEFELSYATEVDEYNQLGAVYQEELRRAGIRMSLNPIEWATFSQRVHERQFDACMLAWLTTLMPDPYQLWHSSQAESGSNYPGFKNAEADKILEDARTEFDHEKRIQMYHRFQEILHEEQPYLFLYSRPALAALDKRFHGVVIHKDGIDPEEWWVPTAMQRYK